MQLASACWLPAVCPSRCHLTLLQCLSLPIAYSPGPTKRFLLTCLLIFWTHLQLDSRAQLSTPSSCVQAWPVPLPALTEPADACSLTVGQPF